MAQRGSAGGRDDALTNYQPCCRELSRPRLQPKLRSRLSSRTLIAPAVSLVTLESFSMADRSSQCSSCQIAARKIRPSILCSQGASSWKSTCSAQMPNEPRQLPLEVCALSDAECDWMREERWAIAAWAASPSWEELVERPLGSITTGTGMTTVQRRLSMADASMGGEGSRIFVSTTGAAYPGAMDRAARAAGLFRGA
jgi:hypothetical protein